MATKYPSLIIDKKFEPIVSDYRFDHERYANFLADQGVSNKAISQVIVTFGTAEDVRPNGNTVGEYYSCGQGRQLKRKVFIVPHEENGTLREQGDTFRHETKHLIMDVDRAPQSAWSMRDAFWHNIRTGQLLPLVVASSVMYSMVNKRNDTYDERCALRAEREFRKALPDGVLFVNFDVKALEDSIRAERRARNEWPLT